MHYSYRTLISLSLAAVLAVVLVGCDSFTDGFTKDPTQATETTADLALNSAEVATILYQDGNHARMAAIFNSQLTGADRQYAGFDVYNVNSSDFDNMWVTGYADAIGDLQVVKNKARGSNPLTLGIAQVLEAYMFGTKAALHGAVPFKQAAKGSDNLDPKFTPQMDIYSAVVGSLDTAISNLDAGGIPPSKDIFFGGDKAKWKQVAYTLKARFLLHMNRPADAITAAQNGISAAANNMMAPHGATRSVNSNPFWLFHDIERTGYLQAANSYAADILDTTATNSNYRGNAKTDETARYRDYFTGEAGSWDLNTASGAYFGQTSDYPLVTYRENELIKAEAHLLKSSPDMSAALTALNNAREAADSKYPSGDYYQNYVMSDFQSGNMANPQQESQRKALLREVLEEKYVSLMAHIEVFNDVRRTDNYLGIPPKRGNQLPQRFLIAQTEINANKNITDPPGLFEVTPANQFTYPGF